MSRFKCFTIEQFSAYVDEIVISRTIKEIHIHHTWIPDYEDFYILLEDDPASVYRIIEGMYIWHTKNNGWKDIGQHISIDPEGGIWTGRDFNLSPASIKGRNTYGFAIENIGNFDKKKDTMTQEQLSSLIAVINIIIKKIGIIPTKTTIVYHNQYADKSCPGTAFIKKKKLISLINNTGKEFETMTGTKTLEEITNKDIDKHYVNIAKELQQFLNIQMGANLKIDGIFGKKTLSFLKEIIAFTGTSSIKKILKI